MWGGKHGWAGAGGRRVWTAEGMARAAAVWAPSSRGRPDGSMEPGSSRPGSERAAQWSAPAIGVEGAQPMHVHSWSIATCEIFYEELYNLYM